MRCSRGKKFLLIGIVVGILALGPLYMRTDIVGLFIVLFIHIILAQSWNLIGGYAGQINLGLAAFFGSGALVTHLIWIGGANSFMALLAAGMTGLVLSAVVGFPTLRLRGIYFSMGTLAIAMTAEILVSNLFSGALRAPSIFAAGFTAESRYYVGLISTMISLLAMYLIARSRFGIGLRATRDDEDAARVTGVNTTKLKIEAFLISGFMAGIAGGIFTYYYLTIWPEFQFSTLWTFVPLMIVCIGGMGTLMGPVYGSLILVIIEHIFSRTLGAAHLIIFGIVFIIAVLYFPGGIADGLSKAQKILEGFFSSKKGLTKPTHDTRMAGETRI